jgi:hypothetical protein
MNERKEFIKLTVQAVLAVTLFVAVHALLFYLDRKYFPMFP